MIFLYCKITPLRLPRVVNLNKSAKLTHRHSSHSMVAGLQKRIYLTEAMDGMVM